MSRLVFSGEWAPSNSFEHKQNMRGCKNEAQADSGSASNCRTAAAVGAGMLRSVKAPEILEAS